MRVGFRRLSWTITALAVATAGLQLFRPDLSHSSVNRNLPVPPDVGAVLKQSCYDCHSNQPRLLWFDKMVPAAWLVKRDMTEARERLNFSELPGDPKIANAVVRGAIREVKRGHMPPPLYKLMHPGASVTPEQLSILEEYVTRRSQTASR